MHRPIPAADVGVRLGLPGLVLALFATGCPPNYPKCTENKHCESKGEVCVDGLCKQCAADTDCTEGFRCIENACVPLPQCRIDTDCLAGLRCRNERCVPECSRDGECGSDERCLANRCVDKRACTSSADCGAGDKCEESRCVSAVVESPDAGSGPADEETERLRRLEACVLERVAFDFNGFGLSDAARLSLDRSADCIRHKKRAVVIEGHADERGTEEYNLVLGEKRANSVKRYLVGLGLDEQKLRSVSYGEYRPTDPAQSEDAWARNRRAELAFQ